jgi:acyl-CoA thioesterase-1
MHVGQTNYAQETPEEYRMIVASRYGRFVAAVNSLLLVFLCLNLAQAQAQPVKIAMLGDSLTAGYGLPPGQALPVKIEAALKAKGKDVQILNHGVSGDTAAGGLSRVDWMLADKPDIVLVALGGNDALRGSDPAQLERNLDQIVTKLKAANVTVWLAGMMAPRNFGAEYGAAFDALYKRVADKHGVALYPFLLDGVAADPALNQPDGIHPSGKGVDVLVEKITPFLLKNLDAYATSVRRPARP